MEDCRGPANLDPAVRTADRPDCIRSVSARAETSVGREFAADAGVNPNTMQRALTDLESKGLIITNRTAGRSVTQDMETIKQLRTDRAMEQVRQFLAQMSELGYTKEEIGMVLTQALKEEV